MEVVIEREQRVRLQFPEDAAQLLLDAVNSVKEIPPIHAQLARTQLPICSQQKVKPE